MVWLQLKADSARYRFVTQMVMAARTIRLPNPPLIAIVDDDEAMREALSEFLQVLELSKSYLRWGRRVPGGLCA